MGDTTGDHITQTVKICETSELAPPSWATDSWSSPQAEQQHRQRQHWYHVSIRHVQ